MAETATDKGEAIGIYIHIPFCVRKCDYCDFLSGVYHEELQQRYVAALCREIAFWGGQLRCRKAETVFIGGGTPSWLRETDMARIMESLHASFTVLPDAEVTIECNPGTVTEEKLRVYGQIGINRLSIGLQSANDEELQILGRIHTYERFLHTYDLARKCGFRNINIDIMTGLPRQTQEKLAHTLTSVIRLRPEHVSAYALMIEKGTPFYERYQFDAVKQHAGMETEELPNEEEEYRLYKAAQRALTEAGYEQYEISNYARAGFACRHNIGYWVRRPYIGMGIGAAGFDGHKRSVNITDIYEYIDTMEAEALETSVLWKKQTEISRREAMAEFMFLGLRMNRGVAREDFLREFGIAVEAIYGEQLRQLQAQELVVMEQGRIRLTERGADVSNYVLSHFLQ